MSETDNQPPSPQPPRKGRSELLWLAFAVLVAGSLFASAFLLPVRSSILPMAGNSVAVQNQMADLERKIWTLNSRINDLDARVNAINAAPASEHITDASQTNNQAHMQSDLAALAATVGTLQDDVKKAGNATRAEAQAILNKLVAYMQLRETASASNRGFTGELAAMHKAAENDPALEEILKQLTPNAGKGAPNIAVLREQLLQQTNAAEVATAKAGAQNWWQRILAELRGLVSIRPLHGTGTSHATLTAMDSALAREDLETALAELKNLPPAARQVLGEWQQQAEARKSIADTLQLISGQLTGNENFTSHEASKPAKQMEPPETPKPIRSPKPSAPAESFEPEPSPAPPEQDVP